MKIEICLDDTVKITTYKDDEKIAEQTEIIQAILWDRIVFEDDMFVLKKDILSGDVEIEVISHNP